MVGRTFTEPTAEKTEETVGRTFDEPTAETTEETVGRTLDEPTAETTDEMFARRFLERAVAHSSRAHSGVSNGLRKGAGNVRADVR